jgi:hypothetical protein
LCRYRRIFGEQCRRADDVTAVTLGVPPKEAAMITSIPRPRPRLLVLVGALVAALVAVLVGLVGPAWAGTPPTCGITWGSLEKSAAGPRPASDHVAGLRAGRHACYDRLVVDLGGDARGFRSYDVAYGPVSTEGRGAAVPLRGAADLRIVVRAPAYDAAGHATFTPARPSEAVAVTGFRTFRQVAYAGSFEGQTTIGLGVRARLPFRVFVLAGSPGDPHGARLVVDVAHRW